MKMKLMSKVYPLTVVVSLFGAAVMSGFAAIPEDTTPPYPYPTPTPTASPSPISRIQAFDGAVQGDPGEETADRSG